MFKYFQRCYDDIFSDKSDTTWQLKWETLFCDNFLAIEQQCNWRRPTQVGLFRILPGLILSSSYITTADPTSPVNYKNNDIAEVVGISYVSIVR